MDGNELLDRAERTVQRLLADGADAAEVYAKSEASWQVSGKTGSLEKNFGDLGCVGFGIRAEVKGRLGFSSAPDVSSLDHSARNALEQARRSDALAGSLPQAHPKTPLDPGADSALLLAEEFDLLDFGRKMLIRVATRDPRVHVEGLRLGIRRGYRVVASSSGIAALEPFAFALAQVSGIAVDGELVSVPAEEGCGTSRWSDFEDEISATADRLVVKCVTSLGATGGESYFGSIVLLPEVVHSLLLPPLFASLVDQVPRADHFAKGLPCGSTIASPLVSVRDDPWAIQAITRRSFDREGVPTAPLVIVEGGVIRTRLSVGGTLRSESGRVAGISRGGTDSAPNARPTYPILDEGSTGFADLCSEPIRTLVISRLQILSVNENGDFEGLVLSGLLMRSGERNPVTGLHVIGNVFQALKSVSGVSKERSEVLGEARLPALRIEDLTISAS